MEINSKVKEILQEFHIPLEDGIPYLIALHYGYEPSYIPDVLKSKMNRTNIVVPEKHKTAGLKWNISLFDNQDTNFEWVKEWMEKFRRVNPTRDFSLSNCKRRMKKFFSKYPQYRKDDVMAATDMYLKNIEDRNYMITPHYFIEKGSGATKTEPLLDWCEKYELYKNSEQARKSLSNTMK